MNEKTISDLEYVIESCNEEIEHIKNGYNVTSNNIYTWHAMMLEFLYYEED